VTPLQFEQLYEADWVELESALDKKSQQAGRPVAAARLATLYRRACGHLAIARARAYPTHLIDRLEHLTGQGHQIIYQQREFGLAWLRRTVAHDFPVAVRAHAGYVLVATLLFMAPAVILGLLVYAQPEMILSVIDAETAAEYDEMYSPSAQSIGRVRGADTDWMMFGFYIRNNISVAFQCFAGGLFVGLGSVFFLAFNGAFGGAIAGYLTSRGLSATFYSFIATHAAFELTAIFLSGAAGLRLGRALFAPGRLTRRQSLIGAARESIVLIYGVTGMLLIAAAIEAFWSSATWLSSSVKYGVAALCWAGVILYFTVQGRRAR
jgi:uncharacterized membrane protein SpoIIM required for sporulation